MMGNATLKRTSETDISKCLLSKMQTGDLDLAGFPVINVFEYSKEFVLEMVVPGFTQDQIMVKVVNRELKVFSMIRSLPENTRVGERVLHEEYIINSFYRSFILTEYIDVADISTIYHSGLLKIILPKTITTYPTSFFDK